MEEKSENPIRFQFVSEFNNEVLVARRKNLNKKFGFLLLVCSIFFILPIFAIIFVSKDPSTIAALGFLGFTIFSIGSSVYYFTKNERNIKNADKTITYTFYEDFVEIIKNSSNKNKKGKLIASCLYKNSFLTQTVAKITEFDDCLKLKLIIGRINGMPKYRMEFLPKNVISKEELNNLIQFLKLKLVKKYVVKTSENEKNMSVKKKHIIKYLIIGVVTLICAVLFGNGLYIENDDMAVYPGIILVLIIFYLIFKLVAFIYFKIQNRKSIRDDDDDEWF